MLFTQRTKLPSNPRGNGPMLTLEQLRNDIEQHATRLQWLEDEAKWVRIRLYEKWREMEQIIGADEKACGVNPWPDRPIQQSAGAN
jgi:hypothetical protein